MISFLEAILTVLENVWIYVATALVTVVNLFFNGVGLMIDGVMALLPGISIGETKITPTLLEEINRFFPFDGIVATLTTMLAVYLVWMGFRFILRMLRAA